MRRSPPPREMVVPDMTSTDRPSRTADYAMAGALFGAELFLLPVLFAVYGSGM